MKKVPELSIFFPFWNEQENINTVVEKAIAVAKKLAKKWEIIIVDDGSTDDTAKLAQILVQRFSNLRFIRHFPNGGYGAALREGFKNAKYKLVIFTDGDGQFDFSEITKFLAKIDNYDIVIGFREKRQDSLVRHFLMLYLKIHDLILFGFNFKDIDCGFKLFRKKAIEKIMPLKSEGAMITTEILAKAKKNKLKIAEVGVHHFPRLHGMQSGANLRVLVRAIKESFSLWQELHKKV